MKWLVVCDPELTIEDYGEVLSALPSVEEASGCPSGWRSLYLEATMEQVKPLSELGDQVCRVRPVWEEKSLSTAELLVLGRRVEMEQSRREQRVKEQRESSSDEKSGDT